MYGDGVEQADEGEDPVDLATVCAYDRELPVLGLEPLERLEENVYSGRVHERDLGEVDHDRAAGSLENRRQGISKNGCRLEVDLPVDTEHGCVRVMLVGREQAHREGIRRRPRGLCPSLWD
jgi:hypothetical protein